MSAMDASRVIMIPVDSVMVIVFNTSVTARQSVMSSADLRCSIKLPAENGSPTQTSKSLRLSVPVQPQKSPTAKSQSARTPLARAVRFQLAHALPAEHGTLPTIVET